MWLYFCNSLTPMLCWRAMEVSVSPWATTWLLPLLAEGEGENAGDEADVVVVDAELDGAPSPIMTPGRCSAICS